MKKFLLIILLLAAQANLNAKELRHEGRLLQPPIEGKLLQLPIKRELPLFGSTMIIPKIMHQIWFEVDGKKLPAEYAGWSEKIQTLNPDWKHVLWGRESSRNFMARNYPWFLGTYDAFDKDIKRIDSVRYFLLDHYGGVYLDQSFKGIEPLEPYLSGATFVAAEEKTEPQFINMAFMASIPHHPLWDHVFELLPLSRDLFVTEATGPRFFTGALRKYLKDNASFSIYLYGKKYVYPFPPGQEEETDPVACRVSTENCEILYPEAFLIKFWSGSWLKQYKTRPGPE